MSDVADEASALLADPRTVILDTETTGLHGYMCEIAVIDPHRRILANTQVRPPVPVEPGARRVHGISDAELKIAPKFAEVWNQQLWHVLANRVIVVYNADFDRQVLMRDIEQAWPGKSVATWKSLGSEWFCAMDLRTRFCGFRKQLRGGGHRALFDCYATLDLLFKLADGEDDE